MDTLQSVGRHTYEVAVLVPADRVAEVGARFVRAGSGGVEEREVGETTLAVVYAESRVRARRLASVAGDFGPVRIRVVPSDWQSKWIEYLRPEPITDHIVLAPSGDRGEDDAGLTRLWFEPDLVFGVGSHPTTRLAARAVERVCGLHPGGNLLDVGSGTGVLAMVGIASGAKRALGINVDRKAVRAARRNARLNSLSKECRFSQRSLASIQRSYDVVVVNIETPVLVSLSTDLRRVAAETLILSGVLCERAAEVISCFPGARVRDREGGWALIEVFSRT